MLKGYDKPHLIITKTGKWSERPDRETFLKKMFIDPSTHPFLLQT